MKRSLRRAAPRRPRERRNRSSGSRVESAGILLLATASLLATACGAVPSKCGPFSGGGVGCSPTFAYPSVVRVESGPVRDGVFRCYNSGSGVLLGDRLLVTAAHVVRNRRRVAVHVADRVYEAAPLPGARNDRTDLELITLVGRASRMPGGVRFDGEPLEPGEPPPCAQLAPAAPPAWPEGRLVQVLGYPRDRPTLLRGRIVSPEFRLIRYARESGLKPQSLPELLRGPPSLAGAPGSGRAELDRIQGLATLVERIRQGSMFIQLGSGQTQEGVSGGAVILDGEAVAIPIEAWNSFEETVLIAVPISRSVVADLLRSGASPRLTIDRQSGPG